MSGPDQRKFEFPRLRPYREGFSDEPTEEEVKTFFCDPWPRLADYGRYVTPGSMEMCMTCVRHREHFVSDSYCYCDAYSDCECSVLPVEQEDGTEVCWWYRGAGMLCQVYGLENQWTPGGRKKPNTTLGMPLTRRTPQRKYFNPAVLNLNYDAHSGWRDKPWESDYEAYEAGRHG